MAVPVARVMSLTVRAAAGSGWVRVGVGRGVGVAGGGVVWYGRLGGGRCYLHALTRWPGRALTRSIRVISVGPASGGAGRSSPNQAPPDARRHVAAGWLGRW